MNPDPLHDPAEFGPGALLPLEALAARLKACGRDVKVYRGCRLVPPERISLGDFSQIDEGVRIFAGGEVRIGAHVHLAFSSSISGGGACEIHDFASVGAGSRLITGTELTEGGLVNPTIPAPFRAVARGRIVVQAHAIIFTHCVVLPDVTIGEGAVAGAGCVIHRDLKPWAVYAGNPAVQIGVRSREGVLKHLDALLAVRRTPAA